MGVYSCWAGPLQDILVLRSREDVVDGIDVAGAIPRELGMCGDWGGAKEPARRGRT